METSIHSLMDEISDIKERFIKRKLYLYNKLGAIQKELSNIDKLIEFNDYPEEEQQKLYEKRKSLLTLRRTVKEELKYFEEIDKDNQFTYNSLGYYIKIYNDAKTTIKEIASKSIDFYTSSPETIKRIPLENLSNEEIEKIRVDMEEQYEKVFIDEEENALKAYNKCRVI